MPRKRKDILDDAAKQSPLALLVMEVLLDIRDTLLHLSKRLKGSGGADG